jgi:formylglycine-generating enzyme required for sulfatase activity
MSGRDDVLKRVKIFIASPSDVLEEREIAREVIEQVNRRAAKREGYLLEPLGWEDCYPGKGRPQDLINLFVKKCHLFLGILWCWFGTSTAPEGDPHRFESGTREEFEVARECSESKGVPDIWLFFRQVPEKMRKDPGEQLQKVLAFKKQLQDEQFLLYSPYEDPPEFRDKLEDWLTHWVQDRARECWKPGDPVIRATGPTPPSGTALRRYLDYIVRLHEHIELSGFETRVTVPIDLEKVYIPLRGRLTMMDEGRGRWRRREKPDMIGHEELDKLELGPALRLAAERGLDGLVVLGDPGSGKTTLLKHLLLCFATEKAGEWLGLEEDRIPVFIPLRELRDPNVPLTSLIEDLLRSADLGLPDGFFSGLLEEKRCILLLDGLDEVADEDARRQVCTWIEHARARYAGNWFVVTSRYSGYRRGTRLTGTFLELEVQDLEPDDAKEFLRRWYETVETAIHGEEDVHRDRGKEKAKELIERIWEQREGERIRELVHNPLLLQSIALVHRNRGTLPDQRVELYKECTDLLLEYWDRARGITTRIPLKAKEARQILQPIALWIHQVERRREITGDQVMEVAGPLMDLIRRSPDELLALLERIRDRSGIFVGYDVDSYGFQHLSFQEYLAAEEIKSTGTCEVLVDHFGESWWHEPTLLAVGLEDRKVFESLMQQVIGTPQFERNFEFALRCVKEASLRTVEPFARMLGNPREPGELRCRMAQILGVMGGGNALTALCTALTDTDPQVASAAARALVGLGEEETPEILAALSRVDVLINEKDGSELVLIPAGEFLMGSDDGDEDERPPHAVYLPDYRISRYPVTNRKYGMFLEETRHREPEYWHDRKFNAPNQPVVGVSWHDAQAYCRWAGLRLPTEAEWEKAARGTDGRKYPWGDDDPDESRCNFGNNVGRTTDVGSYPKGVSPYGIHDMAGNVWEWTHSLYKKYPYRPNDGREDEDRSGDRVVRGGSWFIHRGYARGAYRGYGHPGGFDNNFGFRLVVASALVQK